jgi:RNA polymerase sigma-70 factor (ECF subfamily)
MRRDPLADPAPLIRRVYAYVAYRLGDGADAEDVTNDVFERALRYRGSYDESRGGPVPWLLGIARRCIEDARQTGKRHASVAGADGWDASAEQDVSGDVVERMALAAAIERLDDRDRDLVALRYGADLTARQIGELLGLRQNAVEVALHRALARLRGALGGGDETSSRSTRDPAAGTSP